jgi:hypothetical protein
MPNSMMPALLSTAAIGGAPGNDHTSWTRANLGARGAPGARMRREKGGNELRALAFLQTS